MSINIQCINIEQRFYFEQMLFNWSSSQLIAEVYYLQNTLTGIQLPKHPKNEIHTNSNGKTCSFDVETTDVTLNITSQLLMSNKHNLKVVFYVL